MARPHVMLMWLAMLVCGLGCSTTQPSSGRYVRTLEECRAREQEGIPMDMREYTTNVLGVRRFGRGRVEFWEKLLERYMAYREDFYEKYRKHAPAPPGRIMGGGQ